MTAPVAERGIFVLGRQHSGNTLLASLLGQAPGAMALTWEGTFFEHLDEILAANPSRRPGLVVERSGFRGDLHEELTAALASAEDSEPVHLYRHAMSHLARRAGATVWVQKATSYVFYAERMLRLLPECRLVYLVRDPRDVAASTKSRSPSDDHIVGVAVAWQRGQRIADRLAQLHPGRLVIVRYEDLVCDPEATLTRVFDFCGLHFDNAICNRVAVVNPHDAQYRVTSRRGFDRRGVGRYANALTVPELVALGRLTSQESRRRLNYLPDSFELGASSLDRALARVLIARGLLRYARSYARRFGSRPCYAVRRTFVRAGSTVNSTPQT